MPSRTISNSRRLSARADVGSSRIDARSKPVSASARPVPLEADSGPSTVFVTDGLADHRVDVRLATPAAGTQLRGRRRRPPRRLAEVGQRRRPRLAAGARAARGDAGVHRQRDRLGRRPDHRPVVRRDGDPQPMTRQERVRRVVELDPDRASLARGPSAAARRGRRDGSGSARRTSPASTRRRAPRRTAGPRRTPTADRPRGRASTTGAPRISSRSVERRESQVSDRPSSSRWSPGNSGPAAAGAVRAPLAAGQPGDPRRRPGRAARRTAPALARSSRPSPRTQRRARSAATATIGSPTQRPGRSRRTAAAGSASAIQARSIGSSIAPLSMPFSQWSNQRTTSARKS